MKQVIHPKSYNNRWYTESPLENTVSLKLTICFRLSDCGHLWEPLTILSHLDFIFHLKIVPLIV